MYNYLIINHNLFKMNLKIILIIKIQSKSYLFSVINGLVLE